MNAGARWYRTGSAMTCETAGGSGVGPAVIRYCLMYGFATAGEDTEGVGPLRAQREGRITLRHPHVIRVHARLPAEEADDQVEQAARVLPGEEDRESGRDVADVGDDPEHPEHDEVRDEQEPVHERPPARDPLLGIGERRPDRIVRLLAERERRVALRGEEVVARHAQDPAACARQEVED